MFERLKRYRDLPDRVDALAQSLADSATVDDVDQLRDDLKSRTEGFEERLEELAERDEFDPHELEKKLEDLKDEIESGELSQQLSDLDDRIKDLDGQFNNGLTTQELSEQQNLKRMMELETRLHVAELAMVKLREILVSSGLWDPNEDRVKVL